MKKRNGFVSNSSSSSFIVIGKRCNPSDLKIGDFVIGKYMRKGQDGITIADKDMLDFIYNHSEHFHHFFTNARLINMDSDYNHSIINEKDVGKEMYSFEKDYHGSEVLEQLIQNYEERY